MAEPKVQGLEGLSFGAESYVRLLADRLERDLNSADGRSEVVGLFGSWGSGKTTILEAIGGYFEARLQTALQASAGAEKPLPLTIPIAFNPWQFEREEHLIIPLLKTAEIKVAGLARHADARSAAWMLRRAEWIGDAAVALFYGFKGKLKVPFIGEVDFDPSKIFEEAGKRRRALLDRGAHTPSPVESLQANYYQFHDLLHQITGRKEPQVAARRQRFGHWFGAAPQPAGPRLNLLFLIDDLDRCLPDRAVEMIESIKLFLETEGCTFVLALDDEVIQRGISYRYRQYSEDGASPTPGIARPAPITGTEYLEKIVQLPIFVPVPSQAEAMRFLRAQFPTLFGAMAETAAAAGAPPAPSAAPATPATAAGGPRAAREAALLAMLATAVPAVPRKLIRCGKLLEFSRALARRRGWDPSMLTLARLVVLQLLAPDVYRFGRRNVGFLARMEAWARDSQAAASEGSWLTNRWLDAKIASYRSALAPQATPQNANLAQEAETWLPLLELIRASIATRSRFDPRRLVSERPDEATDERLDRYFKLYDDEAVRGAAPVQAVEVRDLESFVNQLCSTDRSQWVSAIGRPELSGNLLGPQTFAALLARVQSQPALVSVPWIEIVAPRLAAAQVRALYAASELLPRLQAARLSALSRELVEQVRSSAQAVAPAARVEEAGDVR